MLDGVSPCPKNPTHPVHAHILTNTHAPSAPYAAFLGSSETPLLLAAENGHLPLIDFLLLECGVDADREQDADGARALHYACMGRSTAAVVHLLERHRADSTLYNHDTGETPLMIAAAHGPIATLRALLADGRSDVEAPRRGRRGGQTAILLAAKGRQWGAVEALLAHGADPTVVWPGRAGFLKRTVLDYARTDPTCPPELLARIEATIAEAERAAFVHRLRFQSDTGAAAAAAPMMTAAAAGVPASAEGRETRGAVARRLVKRVPVCLAGRVRHRRPMPRVEMAVGPAANGPLSKRAKPEQEGGEEDDKVGSVGVLEAVAGHVVLGGMLLDHVKEVLEMLAPPFLHRKEACRARGERGRG